MVAKTIGFNWGPAGTGCGVWTGVRLADVLAHCGMRSAAQGARYVCFRGPRNELPQGAPDPALRSGCHYNPKWVTQPLAPCESPCQGPRTSSPRVRRTILCHACAPHTPNPKLQPLAPVGVSVGDLHEP